MLLTSGRAEAGEAARAPQRACGPSVRFACRPEVTEGDTGR